MFANIFYDVYRRFQWCSRTLLSFCYCHFHFSWMWIIFGNVFMTFMYFHRDSDLFFHFLTTFAILMKVNDILFQEFCWNFQRGYRWLPGTKQCLYLSIALSLPWLLLSIFLFRSIFHPLSLSLSLSLSISLSYDIHCPLKVPGHLCG